jgi:hypothetical protein
MDDTLVRAINVNSMIVRKHVPVIDLKFKIALAAVFALAGWLVFWVLSSSGN